MIEPDVLHASLHFLDNERSFYKFLDAVSQNVKKEYGKCYVRQYCNLHNIKADYPSFNCSITSCRACCTNVAKSICTRHGVSYT